MRIRFLREWRCYHPGSVVELAGGIADTLIRRHFAEEADTPPAEVAAMRPPQTAMKRRRGRPRKMV